MADKVISKIYSTKDVSKFNFNKLNRKLNTRHVTELAMNIAETGIVLIPIVVNKDFIVLDGHHRLSALKLLIDNGEDIEIPYIIREDVDSVTALVNMNAYNKTYGTKEFIDLYSQAQDGQCRKLVQIAEKVNESPVTLISVISCGSDVGRNKEKIKKDQFIDFKEWDVVEDFYDFLAGIKRYVHLTTKTKQMLFRVFQIEKFNSNIFTESVKKCYIDENEKKRFSTQQNTCKTQILELHNQSLKSGNKHYIAYHFDAGHKLIIDE